MSAPAHRDRRPLRHLSLLVALAIVVPACGHRIDRAELLASNGGLPAGVATGGGATPRPGPAEVADPDGAASEPSTAGPAAGAPSTAGGATAAEGGTAAAAGGPCVAQGDTGPITIGSVGSYSGLAGSALLPFVRAVQVWVEHVNSRGGVCGRDVELIVVDDHTDPAQHVAALRDLVQNRDVVAFVGSASGAADAGIRYIESTDVPVIGPTCNSAAVFESSSYFLACSRFTDHIFGIASNAAAYGAPSRDWGLVYCREDASCEEVRDGLIAGGSASQAGLKVRYAGATSIAQPDYTSECRAAQAAGVDTLTVLLDAASFQRFVQSCARQGYNPVYALSSSGATYDTKDFPGLSGGLVLTAPVFGFAGTDTPARREFHSVMRSLYSADPGPAEAQGWTAAKLFEVVATRATQAAGSVTRASLVDALHRLQGETLGGLSIPLTFPAGAPGQYPPCWFVVRLEGSEWTSPTSEALCRG